VGRPEINTNCNEIEELIAQSEMLLDMTKTKLREVRKAIRDPNFLKSAVRSKHFELSRKIDELLKAQIALTEQLDNDHE
jgi:hypothetical protein